MSISVLPVFNCKKILDIQKLISVIQYVSFSIELRSPDERKMCVISIRMRIGYVMFLNDCATREHV